MPILPTSASEYTHYVGALTSILPDPTVKQATFYKPEYPPLSSLLSTYVSKYADPVATLLRNPKFCSPQRPQTRFIEATPIIPEPPIPVCTSLTFSPQQDDHGIPFQSFLVVENAGLFAPGFANFTVQWFQYMDSSLFQPFPRVFSINDDQLAFSWQVTNGDWRAVLFVLGTSYDLGSLSSSDILNQWVFVSLTQEAGTYRLFINGVQTENSYSLGFQNLSDTSPLFIGQNSSLLGVTEGYFGRLTNFHFAIGNVLTSVPTDIIQPVSGTRLLLDVINFDERFEDRSIFANPVTPYGVGWIDSNPFA
jgi:hypothetical protein